MNRLPLPAVLSSVLFLAACDSGGIVGQWKPVDPENPMTLEFRADSTFSMNTGEFVGEGSYTLEGNRDLTLHPRGVLATVVPAGFDGTLVRDSMNLCNPARICTAFSRVDE